MPVALIYLVGGAIGSDIDSVDRTLITVVLPLVRLGLRSIRDRLTLFRYRSLLGVLVRLVVIRRSGLVINSMRWVNVYRRVILTTHVMLVRRLRILLTLARMFVMRRVLAMRGRVLSLSLNSVLFRR